MNPQNKGAMILDMNIQDLNISAAAKAALKSVGLTKVSETGRAKLYHSDRQVPQEF